MIRAVVSDFGGVLTVPLLEGFARYEARSGVSARVIGEALARATAAGGRNPLHELEVGAISEGEFLATLEREASAILGRPVELARFGEDYMAGLEANGELFAYFQGLHARGVRLALLTNNVREWEPYWRTKLPIDDIFETVVDSGFVGVRKPDPAIYAIVLERLGLPADACAFVDDLEANVEAARELGFAGVLHRDTADTIAELDALLAGVAVRPERPEDAGAVRALHLAAFAPSEAEAAIADRLRADGDLVPELSFVALRDGAVVGHVAVSRARVAPERAADAGGAAPIGCAGAEVLALGPLAVRPELQGAGIGGALLRAVEAGAARDGWPLIALLGHAEYYPRFGYERAGALGLACPYDVAPEHWLALRLPAYSPELRGRFRYAEAFSLAG